MKLHKEGKGLIVFSVVLCIILSLASYLLINNIFVFLIIFGISSVEVLFLLIFFRSPKKILESKNKNLVIAPADGKVVNIEEVFEKEYFADKRILVSIFMSPLNVHINWFPISGVISYFKYHSGKFLVAWHPKSSTKNERTTTVIKYDKKKELLVRQIAGIIARRIVSYVKVGLEVKKGEQLGFIKFGSRVDIFLPLGTTINVKKGQKTRGVTTVIATLK